MVVAADEVWGSVGGGNLEETAVARARELLAGAAGPPETMTMSLNDKARTEHGRQCCGGEVTLLLEPLAVVPSVAIFGVGHVGLELARILCPARHRAAPRRLPRRPAGRRAAGRASTTARRPCTSTTRRCRSWCSAQCPRGTHVLVLTHDHAEDFALCDAALRCAHLGSIGLIGSSAKWRRFRQGLPVEGHDDGRRSTGSTRRSATRTWPARNPPPSPSASPPSWCAAFAADRAGVRQVTLFRARVMDTPDDPFTGGTLRSDRRRRAAGRGRGDRRARRLRRRSAPPTPTRRSSTCATACCCPGSSTPTCTSRRSG